MRDLIRMTDDEVAAFLSAGTRVYVSTLSKDGTPHVVPMAYVVLDGKVAFWADEHSQKVKNIRRDPRVGAVVETGTQFEDFKGVQLRGTAEIAEDEATSMRVAGAMLARVPDEYKDMARPTLEGLARDRIVVSIEPTKIASWDHTKLSGLRPQDIGR
jgi:PPOX class probable F420-dependent enzyme